MKELTELFDKIFDKLYYLCPGFVVLGSLMLWTGPYVRATLSTCENATVILGLVLGYVFAWLLAVACQLTQIRFAEANPPATCRLKGYWADPKSYFNCVN